MDFSSLVKPDLILESLDAASRMDALTQMAEYLRRRGYVKESFAEAILAREQAHPSGLPMEGHKIAIPHTDAEHVEQSAILFARLIKPVQFQCMGEPDLTIDVQLISMFALKEAKQIGDLLGALITLYQDSEALDRILNAPDAVTIYRELKTGVALVNG